MKKLLLVMLIILAITGCNQEGSSGNATDSPSPTPVPVASVKPEDPPSPPAEGLEAINEKLSEHMQELGRQQSIAVQSLYSTDEAVKMEVRSFGDVEQILSETDIEAFKQSLFELVGEPFPIDISIRKCCDGKAGVIGKITEVNTERNRILVVNELEKNGNTDDPVAYWVSLTDDGKVFVEGEETTDIFDSALVGKDAQVWTTGMIDQSYPGQVAALKVVAE
ncbi:hypothetical protein [Cohnella sp. WQ 127256]|uniref:hypothetical protein n=1 Tax=Cohnella sp. WQ 127256 TaxID=2938790 RepID=UPI002117E8BC|nr:hypothetical protein [Cohnella sp. WQ 127256]